MASSISLSTAITSLFFCPVGHAFVAAPHITKSPGSTRKTRVNYQYDDEMEYWQRHHYWEEQEARQRQYMQVVQQEVAFDLVDMERQWMEFEQLNHNAVVEQLESMPPPPLSSPPSQHHPHSLGHPDPPGHGLVNRPIPIQMLRTNSDFPARDVPGPQWSFLGRDPLPFEDANPTPSQRISATVLIPCNKNNNHGDSNDRQEYVVLDDGRKFIVQTIIDDVLVAQQHDRDAPPQNAYWLQSQISTAIHGQVRAGTILRRLKEPIQVKMPSNNISHDKSSGEMSSTSSSSSWTLVEWEATDQSVAVKEMDWDHIMNQGQELAEDPIKEVAAMQYLKKWMMSTSSSKKSSSSTSSSTVAASAADVDNEDGGNDLTMNDTHILTPIDILLDDHHLYSVMPYCEGGRLLDRIEGKNRFSEAEARYWMRQILKGLACLKEAGVSHKDLSPENLLVHEGNIFIIDLGMSLRVPFVNDHTNERSLIVPQGVCGKWYYLSPEVCVNEQPFDGPTVDLWAAGVILYMMLTGEPPWEEPKMEDPNFRHISAGGNLMQILTERRAGLSLDAMDLLQSMLWVDPADRLSLEQVMSHPWFSFLDKITIC